METEIQLTYTPSALLLVPSFLPMVRFSLGLSRFSAYGPFPAPASS